MHRTSLFLTEELETGLKALKERYGTPEAESIRRAITAYLRDHGVLKGTPKGQRKGGKRR